MGSTLMGTPLQIKNLTFQILSLCVGRRVRGLHKAQGLCSGLGLIPFQYWLRTNGVDTHGAAAQVIDFDRVGKKARPGIFGKIKAG